MENMYFNPLRCVAVSIHVDDPFIVAKDEEGHEWTHKFMNENFRKLLTFCNNSNRNLD